MLEWETLLSPEKWAQATFGRYGSPMSAEHVVR